MGHLGMARRAGELTDRLAFPIQPEPFQPIDQRGDGSLGGSFPIGVLDTQQHLAALVLREGPAKQCRPRTADVQIPGG